MSNEDTKKIERKMIVVKPFDQLQKFSGSIAIAVIVKTPKEILDAFVGVVMPIGTKDVEDGHLKRDSRFDYYISVKHLAFSVLVNTITNKTSQAAYGFLKDNFQDNEFIIIPKGCLEPVLLLCPHCGGKAKRHEVESGGFDSPQSGCIKCLYCGACGPTLTTDWWEIVDAWNRRV